MKKAYLASLLLLLAFFSSCNKEEVPSPPLVTFSFTSTIAQLIDENSVKLYTNFSFTANTSLVEVKDYGFVYSKTSTPDLQGATIVSLASSTPVQLSNNLYGEKIISALEKGTTYFARSYVVSHAQEAQYGDQISFTTFNGNRFAIGEFFPMRKSGMVGFLIGNNFYMGAGILDGNVTPPDPAFYKYDIEKNKWSEVVAYPGKAQGRASSFTIANSGYIVGGLNNSETWEYNSVNNQWVQKSDFPGPTARESGVAFALNGKGYFGLGAFQNDFWEFDPTDISNGVDAHGMPKGKWTKLNNFPNSAHIRRPTPFWFNNSPYIIGEYPLKIYKYNRETDNWIFVTSFPGASSNSSLNSNAYAFTRGNKFYAVSPVDYKMWAYDPVGDTWSEFAQPNNYFYGSFVYTINDVGYIFSENGGVAKYIP